MSNFHPVSFPYTMQYPGDATTGLQGFPLTKTSSATVMSWSDQLDKQLLASNKPRESDRGNKRTDGLTIKPIS